MSSSNSPVKINNLNYIEKKRKIDQETASLFPILITSHLQDCSVVHIWLKICTECFCDREQCLRAWPSVL